MQNSPLESSCVVVALIATIRKVADSIPDCVIGISLWHNPSDRTMAPGSTQPLTEMITTDICRGGQGVEAAGSQGWQPYHLHVPIAFIKFWEPEPSGTLRACPGPLQVYIYLYNIARFPQQCHNSKCVIFQDRLSKVSKCHNFLWVQRRHNCPPAASFANCVMTLYLLKGASANVSFYTNNSKIAKFWVVTILSQMSDIYKNWNICVKIKNHLGQLLWKQNGSKCIHKMLVGHSSAPSTKRG